jgi:hypothetical protein
MNSPEAAGSYRTLAAAAVVLATAGAVAPACAAEDAGAFEAMLVRDSETTLQFRTYAMDRHYPGPVLNQAWAIGGWLGYRSGWLFDALSFGLVGYTSQPIWAPPDASGTLLLTNDQQGYSVLGQAYLALKLFDQTLTGGYFEVNQSEVNPQDNRMTPQTFSGAALTGRLGGVNYFAGYLDGEKTRNATEFVNFATVAGAPAGVSSPMWLIGLSGEPVRDLALRFSSYHVPDILNSSYADASWLTPLSQDYKLRLGGQAMAQASTGSNALTGDAFSTWAAGVKADLIAGGATATLGYTQIGRGAAYLAPYGAWQGYTFMINQAFSQAGQKTVLIGGNYDFAGLGAPGLVLNAAVAIGRDAIVAPGGAPAANQTEYDLTLDYRLNAPSWPEWARPIWIRARAADVERSLNGVDTRITDYRVIVNYSWVFK